MPQEEKMATARRTNLLRRSLPATVGLPVLVTWVAVQPHDLPIAGAIGVLMTAVSAVISELPRLLWISAYIRLARKGEQLATSVAEVRDLIASLGGAGEVPDAPRAAREKQHD
jgi:hypothetical protein